MHDTENDPMAFLDLKPGKKHNELENEDVEYGEEKDVGSPGHKSKKIVLYSTSKRYVFGFDKVENLMEPSMLDDELMVDTGRDILREINNINYENNHSSFKFMNFPLN